MGKQIVKLFNKSNKTYKMKFLFVFCVIAIAVTQTFGCCIQQPAIVGPSTSACNPVSFQPIGGCTYVPQQQCGYIPQQQCGCSYTPQQQYGCYRRTVRKRTTFTEDQAVNHETMVDVLEHGMDVQLQSTIVKL